MGFGFVVKEILRSREMTIKQLAEEAKIPVNTLYSITKRDSVRVDPVIAVRVCEALKLTSEELLALQPEIDTPENRQSIESGLAAFLEAADEYERKSRIRKESIKKAWRAAEEKEGRSLTFDEAMEHYKVNVSYLNRVKTAFEKLNVIGQQIAAERIEELTKVNDYTMPVIRESTRKRINKPQTDEPQNTDNLPHKKEKNV